MSRQSPSPRRDIPRRESGPVRGIIDFFLNVGYCEVEWALLWSAESRS